MPVHHIVQLTDFHIQADAHATALGLQPFSTLKRTLAQTQQHPCDAYFFTGDLSEDGSQAAYQHIIEATQTISRPIYYVPGNHDCPAVMHQTFANSPLQRTSVVELDPWQIILLDSHLPGHIEGRLDHDQLQSLTQLLNRQKPTLIFVHHNIAEPEELGKLPSMFANTDDLVSTLQPFHAHVKAIVCGHVHAAYDFDYQGFRLLSTPSTCYQFAIEQGQVIQTDAAPGYRSFQLFDDGQFTTQIHCLT